MLKGSPMPAQLLTIPLDCTSTRQCALPRSGFVLGRLAGSHNKPPTDGPRASVADREVASDGRVPGSAQYVCLSIGT
jgi:hypothetical protein